MVNSFKEKPKFAITTFGAKIGKEIHSAVSFDTKTETPVIDSSKFRKYIDHDMKDLSITIDETWSEGDRVMVTMALKDLYDSMSYISAHAKDMMNITMRQMAERVGIEDYDSKTATDEINAKVMTEFNQVSATIDAVTQLSNTLSFKTLEHVTHLVKA